jgi:hypothetical protein
MPQRRSNPNNIGQYSQNQRYELLHNAVNRENKENPKAKITIVDINELDTHIKTCKEERYRLIVKNSAHYTAVDVRNKEGKKSCIVLDAAGDSRGVAVAIAFSHNQFTPKFSGGLQGNPKANLQADAYSCSLFSFDHCVQLYKADENLHEALCEKYDFMIPYDAFPPNFVWNAQSIKFLDAYALIAEKENPGILDKPMTNGFSFREYLQKGMCTYPSQEGHLVTRNESINLHVLQTVESHRPQEVAKNVMTEAFKGTPLANYTNTTVSTLRTMKYIFQQLRKNDPLKENEDKLKPPEKGPGE